MRKELEDAHKGQTMLFDKLISCCKEVRILTLRLQLFLMILVRWMLIHSQTQRKRNAYLLRSGKNWRSAVGAI